MSTSVIGPIITASSASVAKVFLIGLVGYLAVQYPKPSPFIPPSSVESLARMSFHLLLLPLFYETIASTVTLHDLNTLWFIPVGGIFVVGISYGTCTIMGKLFRLQIQSCEEQEQEKEQEEKNKKNVLTQGDYDALRIAASFPNVVSLPILIFPSLCEYEIVYTTFFGKDNKEDASRLEMIQSCTDTTNTMIFLYFFIWSLLFFMWGNFVLLRAVSSKTGKRMEESSGNEDNDDEEFSDNAAAVNVNEELNIDTPTHSNNKNDNQSSFTFLTTIHTTVQKQLHTILQIIKQTLSSPGFIAMALGFVTVCIPPLQRALFEPGGPLRFVGGTLETLGVAASSFSNIVVAASLHLQVEDEKRSHVDENDCDGRMRVGDESDDDDHDMEQDISVREQFSNELHDLNQHNNQVDTEETLQQRRKQHDNEHNKDKSSRNDHSHPNLLSDPNAATSQPQQRRRRSSIQERLKQSSQRAISTMTQTVQKQPASLRIQLWFTLSKLIITPGIVFCILVGLDCGGMLRTILPTGPGKLVLLLNSALPGALTVVVILKSRPECARSASLVASVYLPSYVLSIVSVAVWSVAGLMISVPREDGSSFCG